MTLGKTDYLSFISYILAGSFLSISLLLNFWLPYSYYFSVVLLTLLLIFSFFKSDKSVFFIEIFIYYFLVNNIFNLSDKLSYLPFGDSYWEFGVLKYFSVSDSIFVIFDKSVSDVLTWYSSWPIIHTLTYYFSKVTFIPIYLSTYFVVFGLNIAVFFIIYSIIRKFDVGKDFNTKIFSIIMILFISNPDSIFWRIQFVRQNYSMALFYLAVLILFNIIDKKSIGKKDYFMIIVVSLTAVLAHHFTSFVLLSYCVAIVILLLMTNNIKFLQFMRVENFTNRKFVDLSLIFSAMIAAIYAWWATYSKIIIAAVKWKINIFLSTLFGEKDVTSYSPMVSYPVFLSNKIIIYFSLLRDALIYIFPVINVYFFIKYKIFNGKYVFVVYSILIFGALFIFNVFVTKVEPYRILLFFIPFLLFIYVQNLVNIRNISKKYYSLICLVIVLVAVPASFISVWGHFYYPAQIYDPSIDKDIIGEHRSMSISDSFFKSYIDPVNFKKYYTDSPGNLIFLMPPNEYAKILYLPSAKDLASVKVFTENSIVCEYRGLSGYWYYGGTYRLVNEIAKGGELAALKREILYNSSMNVYSSGYYRYWMR